MRIADPPESGPAARASRVGLGLVLLLAFALRYWRLPQNGWGADYYSAAVRSMQLSWRNFFYASFDPTGFISVDKPPLALWLQAGSVKLFGFEPLALLMPQVLLGVASVWLLYCLARRSFGQATALLAAFLFAIAPVAVAVNRTNNTDSALIFLLLLAASAGSVGADMRLYDLRP